MAGQLKLRRGTTSQHESFTGAEGEVTYDTNKKTIVVHDGTTLGGLPNAVRANEDGTISLIKKDGTSAGVINSVGLFNNTLTSTNTNQAATAAQVKVLYDTLLGVRQTWQDMTASRSYAVTYTNNTGRPIVLYILSNRGHNTSYNFKVTIDGTFSFFSPISSTGSTPQTSVDNLIIPVGSSYKLENGDAGGTATILKWYELR